MSAFISSVGTSNIITSNIGLPEVRFSNLKQMAYSPAHYQHNLVKQRVESVAMRKGSAVDAMIFGTANVIKYEGRRAGKEWTEFQATQPDAYVLNQSEFDATIGMVQSIHAHAVAMDLLNGTQQKTIRWEMSGRACRGTPDIFTADRVVDLKTAKTSHPDWFPRDAGRMSYHAQLAWYMNGLTLAGIAQPSEAWIVAVESKAPHPVTVFQLTPRMIELGNKVWRGYWEQLMTCEQSAFWPGYTQAVVPWDVPGTLEDPVWIAEEEAA